MTTKKTKKKATKKPTTLPTVDNPMTLPGGSMPIGVRDDEPLPNSFKVNAEIKAALSLTRSSPRSRGFHPSAMARLCVMKYWLYENSIKNLAHSDPVVIQHSMATFRAILDTPHDTSPGRIPTHILPDMDGGHSIHRYQQFKYGECGYLWGRWQCPNCDAKTEPGFMPRMTVPDIAGKPLKVAAYCTHCKGGNFRSRYNQVRWLYVEPWMGSPEWDIDGHADGIFLKPYKGLIFPAILEIKSINEAGYYERYGDPLPHPEHVKQASQYVALARATFPWLKDLKHIYFCYVNKNAQRDAKEFLVLADMGVVEEIQATMRHALEINQYDELSEESKAHARKCQSIEAIEATKCPVAELCFGTKRAANIFDPGFNWEELPL